LLDPQLNRHQVLDNRVKLLRSAARAFQGDPGAFAAEHLIESDETLRRNCALDWLLIFGGTSITTTSSDPILRLTLHPPEPAAAPGSGPVLRQQLLNGLINEYHRAA
jgi:hypothetical protein